MQPLWLCSTPRPKRLFVTVNVFLPVKPGELGLRQSDAVFHHTAALPELLRELDAEFPLHRVDAVGVSEKPRPVEGSYMPCFLTGLAVAQGLALARGVPLVRTTHQQGHIAAALLSAAGASLFARRVLVFHISGGTTELLLCSGTSVVCRVGGSTDLYAGQAVDRIGVKLGFAFPAGAELSILASECSEEIKPKVSVKVRTAAFPDWKTSAPHCWNVAQPGLRCEILPECRGPDGTSNDLCRTGTVSRRAGGMRGRRDEQRYHTRLCTADAAGYLFRTGPVFQRQRHRRGRSGGKGGSGMANVITVTALNRYVKTLLERDSVLTDVALRGEISNFTNHYKTGHFYFSLKDEQCSVKAVMFRVMHRIWHSCRRTACEYRAVPDFSVRAGRRVSGLCGRYVSGRYWCNADGIRAAQGKA